jgi:hypothetical protein
MISERCNLDCLNKLSLLKFFPTRNSVLAEIGKLLNSICANDGEARDLVDAICEEHDEWPGPATVRQIYGSVSARKKLPDGCSLCIPQGGFFVMVDGVACRCECARGRALRQTGRQSERAPKQAFRGGF